MGKVIFRSIRYANENQLPARLHGVSVCSNSRPILSLPKAYVRRYVHVVWTINRCSFVSDWSKSKKTAQILENEVLVYFALTTLLEGCRRLFCRPLKGHLRMYMPILIYTHGEGILIRIHTAYKDTNLIILPVKKDVHVHISVKLTRTWTSKKMYHHGVYIFSYRLGKIKTATRCHCKSVIKLYKTRPIFEETFVGQANYNYKRLASGQGMRYILANPAGYVLPIRVRS